MTTKLPSVWMTATAPGLPAVFEAHPGRARTTYLKAVADELRSLSRARAAAVSAMRAAGTVAPRRATRRAPTPTTTPHGAVGLDAPAASASAASAVRTRMGAIARDYDAPARAARTGDAGYRRARAAIAAKERRLGGLLKRLGMWWMPATA